MSQSDSGIIYRRNHGAPYGEAVFPSGTGGDGKIDGDPEDGHYRCKQCGFLNKVQETPSTGGSPEGNGGIEVSDGDPTVVDGCKFCGSFNSR